MRETQVRFLGQEDPLEKEMVTHFSTLAWKCHGQRILVGYSPGSKDLDTTEQLPFFFLSLYFLFFLYCEEWSPDSSVGKESACNAGDPGLISRSGRSAGEGIGYPLQRYWASLISQLIKNPPAMWETWIWSLGWKDPLEKRKATHSSILAWRTLWNIHGHD